jgi:hypothetical protein
MRTFARLLVVVGALVAAQAVGTGAGAAAPCVRVGSACYATVAQALASAADGDTVRVPAGTFPGGLRITKSITLQGAGADRTVLSGGGPVLAIGTAGADTQPRVTLRGVTLTAGRATSTLVPDSPGVAAGGGLQILPSSAGRGGTVTVIDSVIRGNRADPAEQFTDAARPDWPKCPTGPCPFAGAFGAGIDNWGDLTLHGTLVTGNTAAGDLTSDAAGGGIATEAGSLTLEQSTVSGNRALAGDKSGRFAEGGGIFNAEDTSLTLDHSSVVDNQSRLVTGFPSVLDDGTRLDLLANGGGIHVSGTTTPVTVTSSHIDRNMTSVVGPNAQDGAINAGLQAGGGPLEMRDSTVSRNVLSADLRAAPNAPGGAFQWDGVAEISGSEFAGNITTITARQGDATAGGAVAALAIVVQGRDPGPSLVQHSVVRDNLLTVNATTGRATAFGGGVTNDASTVLEDVRIQGNRVVAHSRTAALQGGGVWNGPLPDPTADPAAPPPPPSQLTLRGSRVEGNQLIGPRGAALQGGGVQTEVPVRLTQTRIQNNVPGQCSGPGC